MDVAKQEFMRRRELWVKRGERDGLVGNKPQWFSRAYITGYEKGYDQRKKIIEQEWND